MMEWRLLDVYFEFEYCHERRNELMDCTCILKTYIYASLQDANRKRVVLF